MRPFQRLLEAKAAASWQQAWSAQLAALATHHSVSTAYGVYLGTKVFRQDHVTVPSFAEFSRQLWAGEIFDEGIWRSGTIATSSETPCWRPGSG